MATPSTSTSGEPLTATCPVSPQLLPMYELQDALLLDEDDVMQPIALAADSTSISHLLDSPILSESTWEWNVESMLNNTTTTPTTPTTLSTPSHLYTQSTTDTLSTNPTIPHDTLINLHSFLLHQPTPPIMDINAWIDSIHILASELVLLTKSFLDPKNPQVVHAVYQLCHLSPLVRDVFESTKITDIPLFKRRGRKPRHVVELEEAWDAHSKALLGHSYLSVTPIPSPEPSTETSVSRGSSMGIMDVKPSIHTSGTNSSTTTTKSKKSKSFSSELKASIVRRLSFTREKPPVSPSESSVSSTDPVIECTSRHAMEWTSKSIETPRHHTTSPPSTTSTSATTTTTASALISDKPPLPHSSDPIELTDKNTTKQRWMQKRTEASWQYMSSFTIKKPGSKSKQRT